MRRVAFILLASTALVSAASAADLSSRKAAAAAAAAPITYATSPTWTGFYLGGHAGYGWGTTGWSDTAGWGFDTDMDGFFGGGQIGLNYQVNTLVLGVQGDISGASLEGNTLYDGGSYKSEAAWLASVTGRVGLAVDRALFYVKGGAAWTDIDAGVAGSASGSTRTGWTAGGGLEYALAPNWSAFAEYDYFDFGDKRLSSYEPVKLDSDVNAVKLGVNYRFGAPGAVAPGY